MVKIIFCRTSVLRITVQQKISPRSVLSQMMKTQCLLATHANDVSETKSESEYTKNALKSPYFFDKSPCLLSGALASSHKSERASERVGKSQKDHRTISILKNRDDRLSQKSLLKNVMLFVMDMLPCLIAAIWASAIFISTTNRWI